MYQYTIQDVLQNYTEDFFRIFTSLKLPTSSSKLFFSKTRDKHIYKQIDNRIKNLSDKEKDKLINEFFSILPSEEAFHEYEQAAYEIEDTEFPTFNKHFNDLFEQYKQLTANEKIKILEEMLTQIEGLTAKIRQGISTYAMESEDIEPFLVAEQLLAACYKLAKKTKPKIKNINRSSAKREVNRNLNFMFLSFLNLEALRKGQKTIDEMYSFLVILTTFIDKPFIENQELDQRMYEVFNSA